jgi:hypothetical protein
MFLQRIQATPLFAKTGATRVQKSRLLALSSLRECSFYLYEGLGKNSQNRAAERKE